MLQIKNVNLCVGSNKLLHNINLSLEQGKIYGLLGANGLRYKLKNLSSTSLR